MPGDSACDFSPCGQENNPELWSYRWKWPIDVAFSGRRITSCADCLEKHLGRMGWFHIAMLRARQGAGHA